MRVIHSWSDKVHDKEGLTQPIYDVAWKPDGSLLLATAGPQILVYNSSDGELVNTLKGHKETVYCLSFSSDGKRLVSGGADKTVIIWNHLLEAILKYTHSDTIQAIAMNPMTGQIASCSNSDFGLWSMEQTNVAKYKVPSRILCCSWSNDGLYLALGLFNGNVSIRTTNGDEKVRIERGGAPVWSLQFNPNPRPDKEFDVLAVTDWNQKLTFFQLSGRQVGKERSLGYDPCCVNHFSNGDFLVLGGSDRTVTLWTSDGIKLGMVAQTDGWVWSCKVKPKQNYVAVASHDGTISVHQIVFGTVHGLYQDRYAYRENMTDVVIHHLSTDQRARIKCRDFVKKIAVYRDRLAVQLPERVIIYELYHDDITDMHYRIKEKIHQQLDCSLLVVTSQHIILCLEKKLQMYNFSGEKEREWNLEALIRYIKVTGGQRQREGLLVGLRNGQVSHIFIDNPFPVPIINQGSSIRCLDFNSTRTKIAVVDEENVCSVYNSRSKELVYQEPKVTSVAWNIEHEDMLCYSGNGVLSFKAGDYPPHHQQMQGFVVGFKGSKIFCLHANHISSVDVPQSAALEKYLSKQAFQEAYKIACLGVTETDWRKLALECIEHLDLETAKKSFIRIRDMRYLELVSQIEKRMTQTSISSDIILGDIYAHQGKYHEAAKLFKKSGHPSIAIDMFTELGMWDFATSIAQESHGDVGTILKKKAKVHQDSNNLQAAAQTYMEVGDHWQAVEILGPNGWLDKLIEIVRRVNKTDTKILSQCVHYFRKQNHHTYATETLVKMGDIKHLLELHIELQHWEDAFQLAEMHPEFNERIYLPYARWLAMNDRFVEAQQYFRKAGRTDESIQVLTQLSENAVEERRYDDGAYFFWLLGREQLNNIPTEKERKDLTSSEEKSLDKYYEYQRISEVYYVYHFVYRFLEEPFTSHIPETLFNMERYLLHYSVIHPLPKGVSLSRVLFALTKHASMLGAINLARYAYDRLLQQKLPTLWYEVMERGSLLTRGKDLHDREELLPLCYKCSTTNPLFSSKGNQCVNCQEPFTLSFYSLENLSLVRFVPEADISDDEATTLINTEPLSQLTASQKMLKWQESQKKGQSQSNLLTSQKADEDNFNKLLTSLEAQSLYQPVVANRAILSSLHKNEVFIRKYKHKCLKFEYYKTILPEIPITLCEHCFKFFHSDNYEFLVLQNQACPFCRTPVDMQL